MNAERQRCSVRFVLSISASQQHTNASISIVNNCGHVVSIEQAAQFNAICLSFLSRLK